MWARTSLDGVPFRSHFLGDTTGYVEEKKEGWSGGTSEEAGVGGVGGKSEIVRQGIL